MSHINQLRNKYSRSRGKPVSVDSFVFCVFQEEMALKRSSRLQKENGFEGLDDLFNSHEKEPIVLLKTLFSAYGDKFSDLREEGAVDYVKRTSVALPVASLRFDIDKLLKSLGLSYPFEDPAPSLPEETEETEESQPEAQTLELESIQEEGASEPKEKLEEFQQEVAQEEALKVEEPEEVADAEEEVTEPEEKVEEEPSEEEKPLSLLRSDLEAALEANFPHCFSYLLAYFDWSYSERLEVKRDFDSLPPSGRALLLIKRAFPSSELLWGKSARPVAVVTPQGGSHASKDEEKWALEEVYEAFKSFKEDSKLSSVQLKPQNSFLRRKQHSLISSEGFGSKSVGEEPDRSILILQKTPK